MLKIKLIPLVFIPLLIALSPLLVSAQSEKLQPISDRPIDLSAYELVKVYDNDFSENQKIEYEENLLIRDPDGQYRRIKKPAFDAEWIVEGWGSVEQEDGARCFKWEYEKGLSRHMKNDFHIFRLADVYLMKAESLVRMAMWIVNDP